MRPPSFAEQYQTDWSLWVLDHAVPECPQTIGRDESVPIARWRTPRIAAVLSVRLLYDDAMGEDDLDGDMELFRWVDTEWDYVGGGGGAWWDPPLDRPPAMPRRSAWFGAEAGSGTASWSLTGYYGIAGADAAFVEVADVSGVTRHPIESPFGAFVVCSEGQSAASVRVLDSSGDLLIEETFGGPDLWDMETGPSR